jgi:hypothetical protein
MLSYPSEVSALEVWGAKASLISPLRSRLRTSVVRAALSHSISHASSASISVIFSSPDGRQWLVSLAVLTVTMRLVWVNMTVRLFNIRQERACYQTGFVAFS